MLVSNIHQKEKNKNGGMRPTSANVYTDTCRHMSTDMRMDPPPCMCLDVSIHMCTDMHRGVCMHMCTDMHTQRCIDMGTHVRMRSVCTLGTVIAY